MGWKKSVGYAVGDLGINLYFISSMTFLLYFYTDVLEISAAAAAGVLLVARIVDAVTDPIMGSITALLAVGCDSLGWDYGADIYRARS